MSEPKSTSFVFAFATVETTLCPEFEVTLNFTLPDLPLYPVWVTIILPIVPLISPMADALTESGGSMNFPPLAWLPGITMPPSHL